MPKYKCNYCGAPISSRLGICPYCDKTNNIFSSISALVIKRDIKKVLLNWKAQFDQKVLKNSTVILIKEKIVANNQIKLLRKHIKRLLSKKKNVVILFAIPIGFHLYMRVNYPITAKPFYPELISVAPMLDEAGDFVLYSDGKSNKHYATNKAWCKQYKKTQPISLCLEDIYQPRKYIDIGSKRRDKRAKDWILFRLAEGTLYENMSDAAINCKRGLVAFYKTDGLVGFHAIDPTVPSMFREIEKQKYERKKPDSIARKMGRLWWISNYSYYKDLESGEYLAFSKETIRSYKKDLAERIADKKNCEKKESRYECNSREYPKRIANYRRYIKTAIEDLEYTKVKRRSMAVEYNSLFKKACKSERTFEMYEKLK